MSTVRSLALSHRLATQSRALTADGLSDLASQVYAMVPSGGTNVNRLIPYAVTSHDEAELPSRSQLNLHGACLHALEYR